MCIAEPAFHQSLIAFFFPVTAAFRQLHGGTKQQRTPVKMERHGISFFSTFWARVLKNQKQEKNEGKDREDAKRRGQEHFDGDGCIHKS